MLENKRIVLGITGSIAAYKACILARLLIKKGAEVQVVMTPAAKEFITPLTLATLTRKPVVSEFFDRRDGSWHSHVSLGLWADAMLIAPASASTIGKMANGIVDNMLVTTYLSMKQSATDAPTASGQREERQARRPVFVAPAMDLDMYAHPSTQQNLKRLQSYGDHIIEPGTGFLASSLEGKGRMEEPERIVEALEQYFARQQRLTGKKVLITAGPTYEKIDPVRFVGNYSSGKMGFALAEVCAEQGADVTLVSGPVTLTAKHPAIRRIDVESAAEMYEAATRNFPQSDIAILCAAVADFTPTTTADKKLKRKGDSLYLELRPTQDIAAALGAAKRREQVLVGFALETDNELANARDKMVRKNLDLIVLNSLQDKGAGFRTDTNKVTLIDRQGSVTAFETKPKREVAEDIMEKVGVLGVEN